MRVQVNNYTRIDTCKADYLNNIAICRLCWDNIFGGGKVTSRNETEYRKELY